MRQRMSRWAVLAIAVACAPGALSAQVVIPDTVFARAERPTGTIRGIVQTSDGKPVADAQVTIGELATVRSNGAGSFFLLQVPRGTYTITVRTFGGPPQSDTVAIAGGDTASVTIRLREKLTELETVRAIGQRLIEGPGYSALEDFYRRRQRGFGKFFTREQLERVLTFEQLIRSNMAGVRFNRDMYGNVSIDFARCPPIFGIQPVVYYVDGMQTMAGDLFSWFNPNDIEAMEIYRGSSELPPEARGIACAAVFFWMRR